MKIFVYGSLGLAVLWTAMTSAQADTRMKVVASSTPIYAQANAGAQRVGAATAGEILFVTRTEGDWAAISAPDRLSLWLNKDFIDGNRVVAKSIQVRSGPGIEYSVVGTLERGALVMPRGEDGEWRKIAAPSSATLWVKKSDLTEVRAQSSPIGDVATVPEPKPAPPPPQPAPAPSVPPAPEPPPVPAHTVEVAHAPAPSPSPATPAPAPAVKVAPSTPGAHPAPAAPSKPAPAPQPTHAAPQPKPATPAHAPAPTAPVLRPATSLPAPTPAPAPAPSRPAPGSVPTVRPTPPRPAPAATTKVVPAPASVVTAQRSPAVGVEVNPEFVDELDLDEDVPNQGRAVQVEGELRNAPFTPGSPTRFRLLFHDSAGRLRVRCLVHGDSEILRQYVGQPITIRGRAYWVELSTLPVVVAGQVVPLNPPAESMDD